VMGCFAAILVSVLTNEVQKWRAGMSEMYDLYIRRRQGTRRTTEKWVGANTAPLANQGPRHGTWIGTSAE